MPPQHSYQISNDNPTVIARSMHCRGEAQRKRTERPGTQNTDVIYVAIFPSILVLYHSESRPSFDCGRRSWGHPACMRYQILPSAYSSCESELLNRSTGCSADALLSSTNSGSSSPPSMSKGCTEAPADPSPLLDQPRHLYPDSKGAAMQPCLILADPSP
jgi:hypothetical protein